MKWRRGMKVGWYWLEVIMGCRLMGVGWQYQVRREVGKVWVYMTAAKRREELRQ
jgi:hypothetical protein